MDLKYLLAVRAIIFVSSILYVIIMYMHYVILCRLITSNGGSRGGGGGFQKNVVKNVFCQYIYNITLQNTDFGSASEVI